MYPYQNEYGVSPAEICCYKRLKQSQETGKTRLFQTGMQYRLKGCIGSFQGYWIVTTNKKLRKLKKGQLKTYPRLFDLLI
jgi:hypothetical protein